jgi:acetylornithine aminotransferase
MSNNLMASYQQLPVAFEHGCGAWLTDNKGHRYLDALSGIAVCGLGHAHPVVEQAIAKQAGKLLHTSNIYHIPLQEQLASRLTSLAGMDKVFFCNSGAEANEAAIKIARLHGHKQNIAEPIILVAENSFHGRTMATLSATGSAKAHAGFEPLVQGFVHVTFNDSDAIRQAVQDNPDVVAVMLEPIQGEGGIVIPDKGYLRCIRDICNEHKLLLILDEIQTGMCRTGKWFACQHEDVIPDVMTLAKALGNGVPIGACLACGEAADLIQPGSHGSTFGGNPLASSAALAVLNVLMKDKLDERAAQLGNTMLTAFQDALADIDGIKSVRGKGMMFGIELDMECTALVSKALEEHVLINVTADNVVRLLPPLVITDEEADQIVETVSQVILAFLH